MKYTILGGLLLILALMLGTKNSEVHYMGDNGWCRNYGFPVRLVQITPNGEFGSIRIRHLPLNLLLLVPVLVVLWLGNRRRLVCRVNGILLGVSAIAILYAALRSGTICAIPYLWSLSIYTGWLIWLTAVAGFTCRLRKISKP